MKKWERIGIWFLTGALFIAHIAFRAMAKSFAIQFY